MTHSARNEYLKHVFVKYLPAAADALGVRVCQGKLFATLLSAFSIHHRGNCYDPAVTLSEYYNIYINEEVSRLRSGTDRQNQN